MMKLLKYSNVALSLILIENHRIIDIEIAMCYIVQRFATAHCTLLHIFK